MLRTSILIYRTYVVQLLLVTSGVTRKAPVERTLVSGLPYCSLASGNKQARNHKLDQLTLSSCQLLTLFVNALGGKSAPRELVEHVEHGGINNCRHGTPIGLWIHHFRFFCTSLSPALKLVFGRTNDHGGLFQRGEKRA